MIQSLTEQNTFSCDGCGCNTAREQRTDEEGDQGAEQGLEDAFIEDVDQEAGQQRHQGAVGLQVKQEQGGEVIGQAESGD